MNVRLQDRIWLKEAVKEISTQMQIAINLGT